MPTCFSSEEIHQHSPQAEEWMASAVLALGDDNPKRAEELIRQALEIEPDAPDGLNNLAVGYEMQGRIAEAEALLKPLLSRRRLHNLEFAAFCDAQVERYLTQGNRAADAWLKMWAAEDPENPVIAHLRRELEQPRRRRRLLSGRG